MLAYQDDREFFQKAQSDVINDILTKQTYDVDAVSGATFSSNGIMDAVADVLGSGRSGLEQPVDNSEEDAAGGSVEQDEYLEQPGSSESGLSGDNGSELAESEQETAPASGRFSVADGIYEGTGRGFRGTTSVSVTMEEGVITDITVNYY